MTLLYQETPCKHGNLTGCGILLDVETDERGLQIGAQQEFCPGGSREEMTIDYEAGAKARYKEYAKDAARRDSHPWSWYELPRVPKAKFRHDARVTIDAALGITTEGTR